MSAVAGSFGYFAPGKNILLIITIFSESLNRMIKFNHLTIISYTYQQYLKNSFVHCFIQYLAEYAYTTKVNEKIDVFNFGVVLLELTTRREHESSTMGMAAQQ